jgi:hypothetical protein
MLIGDGMDGAFRNSFGIKPLAALDAWIAGEGSV